MKHLDTHRRQQIIRAAMIGIAAVLAMFVAVGAGIIPLQNARIGALQEANHRRVDENSDLTKIVKATQEQYKDLFAACQSSVECLSKAPAPTIVTGPSGPAGQGATDAQVSRQIEIYCEAHNDCLGPAGANGIGTNGQNGSDGATGAQGAQGDPGMPGADGRGIASTVCDNDGEWQVTYTDGSTQDAGSCRMSLINP